MTDFSEDALEEALRKASDQLDAFAAQADDNERRARALSDAVQTLSATYRSPRGEVEVTAGVGGKIQRIELLAASAQVQPATLGQILVEAISQAQQKAALALAAESANLFGSESTITSELRNDAYRAFPVAGDESR